MNLNEQFKKIISSSFCHLSSEDLKPIALALWHESYTPEISLDELGSEELKKAGYLVDRFRGYNCIPKLQKLKLARFAKKVELRLSYLSIISNNISRTESLEPLAEKWNLNEDISHVMSSLLKFQTRHYVHPSS